MENTRERRVYIAIMVFLLISMTISNFLFDGRSLVFYLGYSLGTVLSSRVLLSSIFLYFLPRYRLVASCCFSLVFAFEKIFFGSYYSDRAIHAEQIVYFFSEMFGYIFGVFFCLSIFDRIKVALKSIRSNEKSNPPIGKEES